MFQFLPISIILICLLGLDHDTNARFDCYLSPAAEISADTDRRILVDHVDIQQCSLRRLLGVNSRSILAPLFTETGLLPIRIRWLILALKRLQYILDDD
jgi:hypothetical protein